MGKIKHSSINSLTGVDISKKSLEECKNRYNNSADPHRPTSAYNFPLTLFYGDFCTQNLQRIVRHPMHLVTCQFSMHYSFATPATAHHFFHMLNSMLKPGFYFAATIPNAIAIVFVFSLSLFLPQAAFSLFSK